MNKIQQLRTIQQLLTDTGRITDIELDENIPQIGFHTSLPTREDDDGETHQEWVDRVTEEGWDNDSINYGGIDRELVGQIESMGFNFVVNDCEGLENEVVIWVKD